MNHVIPLFRLFCLTCLLVVTLMGTNPGSAANPTHTPEPYAPNTPLRFDYLNIEHGLSQSVGEAIYQDSLGYLWIGTQDGLNRYDGHQFTIFRRDSENPYSLTDSHIISITGDDAGNLWIGTINGGLNRYDRQTGHFTHYMNDPKDPQSLGDNCVRTVLVASNGLVWAGSNSGVDVLEPQTGKFVARYRSNSDDPTTLLSNEVNSILEDPDGTMWIATHKGLEHLDPISGAFTHIVNDENDPNSLMGIGVGHMAFGQDNALWLVTANGLDRLDRQSRTFQHFPEDPSSPTGLANNIYDVLEDRAGNVWVGTEDGLFLLHQSTGKFTAYRNKINDPTSLNNNIIFSLYEDSEDILWIGTFGGGVSKLDRGRNKFPLLQYDPAQPKNINSFGVIEDQAGQLWFATYAHGVLRLNRQTGEFTIYKNNPNDPEHGLLDNFTYTLYESDDGIIWIGSGLGLSAFNPNASQAEGQFTQYTFDEKNRENPNRLGGRSAGFIYEDSQGFLWIATGGGADRLDRNTGIFTHYRHDPQDQTSLGYSPVMTIYESRSGDIWLGHTEGGLSRFDPQTGLFSHYRHDPTDPNSLNSNAVHAIHEDQAGTLWLATAYGLDKFDPRTATFTHFTTKEGLPNDMIYAIIEDDAGDYWLSTNYGLARFNPTTGKSHNYDFNDGLQSNEFNLYGAAKTRAGELIFVGITGTNLFRPTDLQPNPYIPPVVITSLTQGGEALRGSNLRVATQTDMQPEIILRWPYNYFEFEFAALSYSDPLQNHYAYRLDKFDKDWVDSGAFNFGRYTNLPGGTYTLRIKGSNNDGVWNEAGTSIKVTVVPAIWQTWWFRSGLVLSVLVGVFVGYRLRVREIKARNRDLERQVDARTHEIEALFEQTKELAIVEERNRLARDLHDSAKQKAFAALAQLGVVRRLLQRDPQTAKKHVEEVENLVYEVIQELSFLIQEMYPLALEEKGLVTILREYIYEWENRNNIHILLEVQHQRRLPLQIEQSLYRIVQESLANIARHSHASQVVIRLNYNEETVELAVDDNGCGFDPQQRPGGVGLRSMQERAALIGGQMAIESVPGSGTHIQVLTPVEIQTPPHNGHKGDQNA